MSKEYDERDIEERIRRGDFASVQGRLKQLATARLLRHQKTQVAQWCWRVGMPDTGARLLHPFIKGTRANFFDAFQTERAEYAMCLVRLGAIDEAWQLLGQESPRDLPVQVLYRAFCLIAQWRYHEAIPMLLKAQSVSAEQSYFNTVIKVNLAAAYVFDGKIPEALALLDSLIALTAGRGFFLLHANCLTVAVQCHLEARDWDRLKSHLREAKELLAPDSGVDRCLIEKWEVIGRLVRGPLTGAVREELGRVRKASARWHLWEVPRQIDAYLALATRDRNLFHRVYFGTPFESFREKLMRAFPEVAIPETHLYRPEPAPRGKSNKKMTIASLPVESGSLLDRLFIALLSDFYRPIRTAALFSALYPGEYFHPSAAPGRVYEAVHRLRRCLRKSRIALDIKTLGTTYQLVATARTAIIVPRERTTVNPRHFALTELKRNLPDAPFSTQEASDRLNLPYRSAFRLLQTGVDKRLIEKVGTGKNTRYRFVA